MKTIHRTLAEQEEPWRQEYLARQRERRRRRKVARLLIDAGYRALALKSHPDVGGSHEAMMRLASVRDTLRDAVGGGRTRRWRITLF